MSKSGNNKHFQFDIARARRETPGCESIAHFNNAGAALMPQIVLDAITDHYRLESEIGGYEAEVRESEKIERVYDSLAKLLNCHRDEIALIENATRAWDMAFYSIPLKAGDRILTTISEYGSNFIAFLQAARRAGAVIDVVANDEHGQISIDALRESMDEKVRLIAITHVPTNGGLVNPAAEVGRVAQEAGALYLLDACQSAGQMPLDVEEIGCDMLSATGRKYLRGPRGTGFLYVRRNVIERLEPPFLDIHAAEWVATDRFEIRADARRFENWETNYATRIGLGMAIDYALEWGIESIEQRVIYLADILRAQLGEIQGVEVTDLGTRRCGIVTFTVEGHDPIDVRRHLSPRNINVWSSPKSSTLIDMDMRGLGEVVRASVHYYNTEEEIDRLCEELKIFLKNNA
jgi:selenocysteine lyase/cysteine desulfurase